MNTVEVTGPGQITGQQTSGGYTYNQWTFPVVVNGEAGVASVYALPDVSYEDIVDYLIEQLEEGNIDLGGISENDGPGTDMGDTDMGDDDDSALASNDGGDFGDSA